VRRQKTVFAAARAFLLDRFLDLGEPFLDFFPRLHSFQQFRVACEEKTPALACCSKEA